MGLLSGYSNVFTGGIISILDYADLNKYKTARSLSGFDNNGGGYSLVTSGSWRSTSSITSLTLTCSNSSVFTQYSQFALFGER
jgi:hypothetical protein